MNTWFQCKVKYQKLDEEGRQKFVTEPYLLDAVSFTEAESRAFEKLGEEIDGEFSVTNLSKTNFTEIVPNENADDWYKCKVAFVMLDEDSGKEKKVNNYFLVQANNVKEAVEGVEESLKEMLVPFEIPSVALTPIMEVWPYFSDDPNEKIPDNLTPVAEYNKKLEEKDTYINDDDIDESETSGGYFADEDEED